MLWKHFYLNGDTFFFAVVIWQHAGNYTALVMSEIRWKWLRSQCIGLDAPLLLLDTFSSIILKGNMGESSLNLQNRLETLQVHCTWNIREFCHVHLTKHDLMPCRVVIEHWLISAAVLSEVKILSYSTHFIYFIIFKTQTVYVQEHFQVFYCRWTVVDCDMTVPDHLYRVQQRPACSYCCCHLLWGSTKGM